MSFWHRDGRIYQGDLAQGRPAELSVDFAQAICRVYVREFKAAWRTHDRTMATAVAIAHDELSAALRERAAYHRKQPQEG